MIKTVNITTYFLFLILLNSCGGFSDVGKVLRNEKTRTTDEFLVKKESHCLFHQISKHCQNLIQQRIVQKRL